MKNAGVVIVLSAVAAVGLGLIHPFGDPRVERQKGLDTLLVNASMSRQAKNVLIAKCADCHSSETRWPAYARLAPGSWLIERDIAAARKNVNLSGWDQMPADTQQILTGEIIHEAKNGDMPPLQYRALHWGAKLTAADIATLSTMQQPSAPDAAQTVAGDAARGKLVFEKRCTGCHSMTEDHEGPRLAGVFGRKAGSVPGFTYSAGLRNSGITWNQSTLEKWLSDPDLVVPDTSMDFHVPKAQERSDLIAYFKQ